MGIHSKLKVGFYYYYFSVFDCHAALPIPNYGDLQVQFFSKASCTCSLNFKVKTLCINNVHACNDERKRKMQHEE